MTMSTVMLNENLSHRQPDAEEEHARHSRFVWRHDATLNVIPLDHFVCQTAIDIRPTSPANSFAASFLDGSPAWLPLARAPQPHKNTANLLPKFPLFNMLPTFRTTDKYCVTTMMHTNTQLPPNLFLSRYLVGVSYYTSGITFETMTSYL